MGGNKAARYLIAIYNWMIYTVYSILCCILSAFFKCECKITTFFPYGRIFCEAFLYFRLKMLILVCSCHFFVVILQPKKQL